MHAFVNENFSAHGNSIGTTQAVIKFVRQAFIHHQVDVRTIQFRIIFDQAIQANRREQVFVLEKRMLGANSCRREGFVENRYLGFGKKSTSGNISCHTIVKPNV